MSYRKALATTLLVFAVPTLYAQSSTPHQDPADAWFTGPLIAANPVSLTRGGVLLEPYLLWNHTNGQFDTHGHRHDTHTTANSWNISMPAYYGITDRLTSVLLFNASDRYGTAGHSEGMRFGDLGVRLDYELLAGNPQRHLPTVAVTLTENLPTGRYDHLGSNVQNGAGSGVHSTALAVNTQTYFWTPNGRILRVRANLSWTWPNRRVNVGGASVYGTEQGFHGHAHTGRTLEAVLGFEYSINSRWALALDWDYTQTGRTLVRGVYAPTDEIFDSNTGRSHAISLAPAMEYHWSPNVGVIAGVNFTPAGRNTSSQVVPQMALNLVY